MPTTPVQLAMTYGNPSIRQGLDALSEQGVDNILVMPLYPQYSSSTTAAIFDRVAAELGEAVQCPAIAFCEAVLRGC